MPDLVGPIQSLELASWLWLIPLPPLLGALVNALWGSGLLAQAFQALRLAFADDDGPKPALTPRVTARAPQVARIAQTSMLLCLAAAAAESAALFQCEPEDRFFLRHLWQLVRVGPLDVGLDLALDPLSAVMALVVTVLATLVGFALVAPGSAAASVHAWRVQAWFGGFVSSVLVVVLADNLGLVLVGWAGVGVAGYGLAGDARGERGFVVQRLAEVALALGVALLFWGLGGEWTSAGEYQSDLDPRLSAVSVVHPGQPRPDADPTLRGGAATHGRGFLTVTALPGALVYMDESRSPMLDDKGAPLVTPFRRHPVEGGAHSFRVAPDDRFRAVGHDPKPGFAFIGGVLPNYSIPRTAFGADREVALALLGPTLKLREIEDQLVVTDARSTHPFKDHLLAKRVGGRIGLVTLACLLVLVGAAAKSAAFPLHGWLVAMAEGPIPLSALVQGAGTVMVGAYLLARLSFLFSLSEAASAALAILGACSALAFALASASHYDLRRILAYGTMSQVGLAFLAFGAGAYPAGVLQLVTHATAKTALLVAAGAALGATRATEKKGAKGFDLREMGGLAAAVPRAAWAYRVACAALTAVPIPLIGGFFAQAAILEGTFTATVLDGALAKGLYAVVLVTSALTSFGMWRSYYLAFTGPSRRGRASDEAPAASARVMTALAGLAALAGLCLGISGRELGSDSEPLLENGLASAFSTVGLRVLDVSVAMRLGLVGLGLAFAYAGWAIARHRYGEGRPDDWAARESSLFVLRLGAGVR